jgi:diketogulonate reductase-like aldo/keto reductase
MTETPSELFVYPSKQETLFHKRIYPVILGTARFGAKDPQDPITGYFPPDLTNKASEVISIVHAVKAGFGRIGIDTGRAYGNSEQIIGEALQFVDRDSVFIITKVGIRPGSREYIRSEIETSRKMLGTPPDMVMMHSRWETGEMTICIKELLRARDKGITASIGVSNLQRDEFLQAIELSENTIAAYDAKLNIINPRRDFRDIKAICEEYGIPYIGHSALDRKSVLQLTDNPFLIELSEKYHMTIAQLGIFAVRLAGVIPVVMSKSPKHIDEDFRAIEMGMEQKDADMLLEMMMSKVTPLNK